MISFSLSLDIMTILSWLLQLDIKSSSYMRPPTLFVFKNSWLFYMHFTFIEFYNQPVNFYKTSGFLGRSGVGIESKDQFGDN